MDTDNFLLKVGSFLQYIAFFISDTFLISLDFIFVSGLYFLFFFFFSLFLIHINTDEKQFSKTRKKKRNILKNEKKN